MRVTLRIATLEDLPAIVRMLADDFLGRQRERFEDPLPDSYVRAFNEIDRDTNNELIVAEDADKSVRGPRVVGALQLTYTPSISFQGSRRCTVESVRVDSAHRAKGI